MYPALFLDRVRQQAIFDNLGQTSPATNIDDKTHTVDVTLTFFVSAPVPAPVRRRAP